MRLAAEGTGVGALTGIVGVGGGFLIVPALVLGVSTTVYLLTAAYHIGSYDVLAANLASWQLATSGSPVLEPSTFPPLQSHQLRDVWIIQRADGNEVIGRSPGAVLAAVPAVAAPLDLTAEKGARLVGEKDDDDEDERLDDEHLIGADAAEQRVT